MKGNMHVQITADETEILEKDVRENLRDNIRASINDCLNIAKEHLATALEDCVIRGGFHAAKAEVLFIGLRRRSRLNCACSIAHLPVAVLKGT